jgi:DNA-binding NarL/FixJ family response regulator
MSPDQRISVLLTGSHPLIRRGLRRILEDDPLIEVVGEAGDGPAAVYLAESLKPRVVVMDSMLPGLSALAAMRQILRRSPDVAVLLISMRDAHETVRPAIDGGARGYLSTAFDLDLTDAVKRVADGEIVLDPTLRDDDSAMAREVEPALTPRELEVLQLICAGRSNRQIASDLHLSTNTVAVHRANLMNALGLHKTAELVTYAIRHGLVTL